MESKSFVLGVACGAFLTSGVVWLLEDSDEATPESASAAMSTSAETLHDVPVAEIENNTSPASVSPQYTDSTVAERDISNPRDSVVELSIQSENPQPTPVTAEQNLLIKWAELQSEPKDNSWGYFMDETITQFLGSYPTINEFDISYVECRTTLCQIQVTGYDESTGPTWNRIMFDLRQQPWAEFGEAGTSHFDVDGRFVILQTLRRAN